MRSDCATKKKREKVKFGDVNVFSWRLVYPHPGFHYEISLALSSDTVRYVVDKGVVAVLRLCSAVVGGETEAGAAQSARRFRELAGRDILRAITLYENDLTTKLMTDHGSIYLKSLPRWRLRRCRC